MKRIAIVGGGAAGMAAAISAARRLAGQPERIEIVVVERLARAGKKLLATGNGRCNLTNAEISPACYQTGTPDALAEVLDGFGADEIRLFFERAGLLCAEREAGRIYPMSNQASSVLDVLLAELERLGVRMYCESGVRAVRPAQAGWALSLDGGETLRADRVILAAGGKAAPVFGTDGSGFSLAKSLGHTVAAPYPALVPLKTDGELARGLKGVRAVCAATLLRDGTPVARETGEVQFAEYGLSGIPIMQLSNRLGAGAEKRWTVELDLFPATERDVLRAMLERRTHARADEPLETLLVGTAHKKLGYAAMKAAGLAPLSRRNGSLSDEEIERLADALKALRFAVNGTLGWTQAQVTGGGVPLGEVRADSMESRRAPGVYLCGELLDVLGECGGFNLHWAWTTGIRAGAAAAEALMEPAARR